MMTNPHSALAMIADSPSLAAVLDLLVRGTVVLAVTALATTILQRRISAATRHGILALGMVGVVVLPILSSVLPSRNVFRADTTPPVTDGAPLTGAFRATEPAPMPPLTSGSQPNAPSTQEGVASAIANAEPRPPAAPDAVEERSVPRAHSLSSADTVPLSPLPRWILGIWLAGTGFLLLRLLASQLGIRRLRHRSHEVSDGPLADEIRETARQVGLDPGRTVLLVAHAQTVPMTWGMFRPHILLPDQAEKAWNPARRRAVLLHELAHVKRRDCLVQFVGQIACAVYWFHPLVWLTARRMESEREQACDDLVLGHGFAATDYADYVLEFSASVRTPGPVADLAGLAMARPHNLELRLKAILDRTRVRSVASQRQRALSGIAFFSLLLTPLSMVTAVSPQKPEDAPATAGNSADTATRNEAGEKPPVDENSKEEIDDLLHEIEVTVRSLQANGTTTEEFSRLALSLAALVKQLQEIAPEKHGPGVPFLGDLPILGRLFDNATEKVNSPPVSATVKLTSARPGIIRNVEVRKDDTVKKGDIILVLDAREAEGRIRIEQGKLGVAAAAMKISGIELKIARRNLERSRRLEEARGEGSGNVADAENAVLSAEAELAKTEAEFEVAQTRLDQAMLELQQHSLRAPADGTILVFNCHPGEYVMPEKHVGLLRPDPPTNPED